MENQLVIYCHELEEWVRGQLLTNPFHSAVMIIFWIKIIAFIVGLVTLINLQKSGENFKIS